MMVCGNCGHDGANCQGFCTQCGASTSRFIALAAATQRAKTRNGAECEASQSGGEAVTPTITDQNPIGGDDTDDTARSN